jgi:3-isopropylmalate/(R)-2-methylmalate dehydratase small subunit
VTTPSDIFSTFAGSEASVETDLDNSVLRISGSGKVKEYSFKIGEFDLALVKAGGWVAYADKKY